MLRLLGEEQRWGWNSAVVTLADGRLRSEVGHARRSGVLPGYRTNAPFASHLRYLARVPTIVRLTWGWRPNFGPRLDVSR
jgi:hypothetical protein